MVRASGKTYYGGKGRFKNNQSRTPGKGNGNQRGPYLKIKEVNPKEFNPILKQNKKKPEYKYRCICGQEMYLIDGVYPYHQNGWDQCVGIGRLRYFWLISE